MTAYIGSPAWMVVCVVPAALLLYSIGASIVGAHKRRDRR